MLPGDQRTQDHWFNTDLFERNSARVPTSFHRRVFPSRMNWLRTETFMQVDANLVKNITITERVRSSFRVDLINALNKQVSEIPA